VPLNSTPCVSSRRPVCITAPTCCARCATSGLATGGSGLIAFHGQSGDIMFQGIKTADVQPAFDAFNEMGFDLGGAGPALRTSMSCVGAARCEHVLLSTKPRRACVPSSTTTWTTCIVRPCLTSSSSSSRAAANDCVNAIQRSDMATIGTWRDNIRADEKLAAGLVLARFTAWNDLVNDVISQTARPRPSQLVSTDKFKAAAASMSQGGQSWRRQLSCASTTRTVCAACTA
jgi:dissimilatory sulfite reductase alpha subunit